MTPSSRHVELLALGGVVATLAALYLKPFIDLVGIWFADENVSHSFLLLPVMAYLVWMRRDRLLAVERRPTLIGLAVVIASLGLLLLGTAGVEFFIMRTSAVGVIAGSILFLGGWRWLRILAFPLALSFLVIPIPPVIFYQVTFPLQLVATKFGVTVLQAVGIPALREGNVIWLTHATLEVTEACSGIRSLFSLFSVAVLYGYFSDSRVIPRAIIALSSVPIAIFTNGLRVAGTGLAAQYIGPQAATGFFHAFQGWVMFLASLAILMAITAIVKRAGRMARGPLAQASPEPAVS